MYFFEGRDLNIQLCWKFDRYEHRDDTFIVDGDQEGVKFQLSFVLTDQVKELPFLGLGDRTMLLF